MKHLNEFKLNEDNYKNDPYDKLFSNENKTIVLEKRNDDIKAYLKDNTKVWSAGKSIQTAVGNLILTHQGFFNINIEGLEEFEKYFKK